MTPARAIPPDVLAWGKECAASPRGDTGVRWLAAETGFTVREWRIALGHRPPDPPRPAIISTPKVKPPPRKRGPRPRGHVGRLTIEAAALLYTDTDTPVAAIAHRCGVSKQALYAALSRYGVTTRAAAACDT